MSGEVKRLRKIIEKGLETVEKYGKIESLLRISGGDINEAYYIRSSKNEYFVKLNKNVDISFFEMEADALAVIRGTNTIHVPKVYEVITVEVEPAPIPMLWMEWVEGKKKKDTETLLGERLAAMHLCTGSGYGLEKDSYIGMLKQENMLMSSWVSYYRDFRLGGQLRIGKKLGTISGNREQNLIHLMEHLDKWIPDKPKASILHGDLWGGNWITGKEGNPYLIDPSVLYGDHEYELAFTELFGGFSAAFYQAYQSVFPFSDEYQARKEIYQLYYLLVHLNMFGEVYGRDVDRILNKYI